MTYRDYTKTSQKRLKSCDEDRGDPGYPDVESNTKSMPFTDAIMETVGYIYNELNETRFCLGAIDDRIFGIRDGDDGDDVGKEPSCYEARILSALRDLVVLSQQNRFKAQNINARL